MPSKNAGNSNSSTNPTAIGAGLVALGSGLVALANSKNLSLLLIFAVIFFLALLAVFAFVAETAGRDGEPK